MNGEKVPQDKLDYILEAIRLSASSVGLQPYTVLVIENEEVRKEIQKVAYNQPQIVEGSHVIVFAAWEKITEEQIDAYMQHTAAVRNVPLESLEGFRNSILGSVKSRTDEQNFEWAARQTYIALGTGLIAAAEQGVDATPMEGFDPKGLDEVLQLKEKGLRSVSMMTIGYRNKAEDFLATARKVRRSKEELFITIK